MGRLGINFSDETNRSFKIEKRKLYSTVVNLDRREVEENRLDRAIAWVSYFILVIVALCVFNQPAMASMVAAVTPAERMQAVAPSNDDTDRESILRGIIVR